MKNGTITTVHAIRLDAQPYVGTNNPKELALFCQDLLAVCADNYGASALVGISGWPHNSAIEVVFRDLRTVEAFANDWIAVARRVEAERRSGLFTLDPNDIPF